MLRLAQALCYLAKVAADVKSFDEGLAVKLQNQVLVFFMSPLAFYEKFCKGSGDEAEGFATAADAEDQPTTGDNVSSSSLDEVKDGLSKGAQLLVDILFGLHVGTFDASLRELACKSDQEFAKALESAEETKNNQLAKDLREVIRLLITTVTSTVSADASSTAPPLGLRQLARMRSNPEDDKDGAVAREREAVWKQAVTVRKRYATLSVPKVPGVDGLIGAFKACGAVQSFKGVLNESRRLFVMSADLVAETDERPWTGMSSPSKETLESFTKFMQVQIGTTDFLLLLDGRMRESRLAIGEWAASRPHMAELFVVYSGRTVRAGRTRKTVLSASLVETGAVVLPCAANKLHLQKREEHNACKESSTFHNTYSGVAVRKTAEIPLISRSEKEAIGFRRSDKEAPEKWTHGSSEPLFWQEVKSISFWLSILADLRIKAVFDLTAGSGALAEASMAEGILYHGLCWLPGPSWF